MKLECEGKLAIDTPKESQVRQAIKALRSYGPSSYASITDEVGNYVQVAGGGVTCMLELFDLNTNERFRAYHDSPSRVFPDGTQLVFKAGILTMKSDEWFSADKVIDVFLCFLRKKEFPADVHWRPVAGL